MGCYKSNPMHRNGAPQKSQWDIDNISIQKEESILNEFSEISIQNENNSNYCPVFGLNIKDNSKADYLGFPAVSSASVMKKLFVAKFVSDMQAGIEVWHGYPADFTKKQQDRPDENSLKKWEEKKHINKAMMRKIIKGQKCKL